MPVFQPGDTQEQFDFTVTLDGTDRQVSVKIPLDEFWDMAFQTFDEWQKARAADTPAVVDPLLPVYIAPGDPTRVPLPDGSLMTIDADGTIRQDGIILTAASGAPALGQLMLVYGNTVGCKGKTSGQWSKRTPGNWAFVVGGDPAIWK